MQRVYYTEKPERIKYMTQQDGHADVWLRKNITEYSHEEIVGQESRGYYADEVYLSTKLTYDQVDEQFDDLFEHGTPEIVDVTLEERVDALEGVVLELLGGE